MHHLPEVMTTALNILSSAHPCPQVSSTETGVIFGNIVYEGTGYAERSVVVLNDIHIDIMDYISPAVCPDVQFRCGTACIGASHVCIHHACAFAGTG